MTVYRQLIEDLAPQFGLDPNVVEAVVIKESSAQTDAFRFEPGVWERLRTNPKWAGMNPRRAASSYGLMQIMYPTAMDLGFNGQPEELFIPEVGLRFGCLYLKKMIQRFGSLQTALGAYNGGPGNALKPQPQAYAAAVLGILAGIRKVHPEPQP